MKFDIKFLPARFGDCIWIEYGNETKINRILIDGGTAGTKSDIKKLISLLSEEERHFELMVVTHIDRDHIEGILSLLEDNTISFGVDDFWFNGWHHLPETLETLGAVQGERLTAAILKRNFKWNYEFAGKAVVIPASGKLPVINLRGGMKLTLLSPKIQNLINLKSKWEYEVKEAGLIPGFVLKPPEIEPGLESLGGMPDVDALNNEVFKEDTAAANGSSIAFLAEYGGKTVLFAGDSFPGIILDSLNMIYEGKAPVDLVKLSHHASAHNTSPELIEKFSCDKYLISTDGSVFHHPAPVTIARVIKRANENVYLIFNYRSEENMIWDSSLLKLQYRYNTEYPTGDGINVDLIKGQSIV